MKNMKYFILTVFAVIFIAASCRQDMPVEFDVDASVIEVGPEGGVRTFTVNADENWTASSPSPWVTVSPSNGHGSVECKVMIDSALSVSPRQTKIRIENQNTSERKEFVIKQGGFPYEIRVDKPQVDVESYASLEKRFFTVKVKSNMQFDITVEGENSDWLKYEAPKLVLDREARPREVDVKFSWDVNFNPADRNVKIKFVPKDQQLTASVLESIDVRQFGAEEIEIGVQGDSLALIAISRALGCYTEFDTSEKMEHWTGVEVWKSGPNKGRVKKAEFTMFRTKEGIPYQVKNLTAADELIFYGNTNTFLLSLDPGEHICQLTQLRKLTLAAYGFVSLPESLKNLSNLEYLDINGNNFQTVPSVLTPENFPKLTALVMNACQRRVIDDLSTTTLTDFGGFYEEVDIDYNNNKTFPKRLLKWENLDTLWLSVNYLEGTIPDLKDDTDFQKWTAEEVHACDTLPEILIGKPKVLPNTDFFAINLNRLHGTLPDWLLYHPKLDLWTPMSLVFMQIGKTSYGVKAGFDNEPANMDYYYEHYVNKKYNPANLKMEE